MKTIYVIIIIVVLLLLDWAAIHDIMIGEENLIAEYGMLGVSLIIFALLISWGIKMKHQKKSES